MNEVIEMLIYQWKSAEDISKGYVGKLNKTNEEKEKILDKIKHNEEFKIQLEKVLEKLGADITKVMKEYDEKYRVELDL